MDNLKIITRTLCHTLLLVLTVQVCFAQQRTSQRDECFQCHRSLEDKPSALFSTDVHFQKGLGCAACHGGDPTKGDNELAMSKTSGYIGVPKRDAISTMCASCHGDATKMKSYKSSLPTDQWENLKKSVHGKSSTAAKQHVAQCTTCHSVHNISAVKSPASPVHPLNVVQTCSKCHADVALMRTYNPSLPVDQLEKYKTSVHGMKHAKGDAKVAQCASCHGSHDIRSAKDVKSKVYGVNLPETCGNCHSDSRYMKEYGIPTNQLEKFKKSVHGVALLQKKDLGAPACNDCHGNHGAVPPGVQSISNVCGTCHSLNADLFSSSPHKKAFDDKKLPECETCHGNHEIITATNQLLGVTPEAVCSRCHQQTNNVKGYQVAGTMRALIDSLESSTKKANILIENAEQRGMEVSDAAFKLRDARQARLQARTMVHSFSEQKFRDVVQQGLTIAHDVQLEGSEAIDQYYFRRWGLGIASLIITILAVSLYLFIRKIERKQIP
ncbi:MAG: cytochrome c3 family protein [bacterium]